MTFKPKDRDKQKQAEHMRKVRGVPKKGDRSRRAMITIQNQSQLKTKLLDSYDCHYDIVSFTSAKMLSLIKTALEASSQPHQWNQYHLGREIIKRFAQDPTIINSISIQDLQALADVQSKSTNSMATLAKILTTCFEMEMKDVEGKNKAEPNMDDMRSFFKDQMKQAEKEKDKEDTQGVVLELIKAHGPKSK